jgi:Xaa-Pro aminopeptidase
LPLLERNGHPCFSDEEFARRHEATRAVMDSESLDALLLFGNRAAHHEVQYLTNLPVAFEAMLLFPMRGDAVLWVNYANHQATAQAVAIVADVRWGGDDLPATAAAELAARSLTPARIGVAGPLSHARWTALARQLPHAEPIDVSAALSRRRLVKSEEEIAWARRGAELTDLAIDALRREIRPGLTENDLAAIAQGAYYGLGGRTHIHYIGSTPMSAPRLCAPSQLQSNRRLEPGDVVLTELSAMYHGYWGQCLRCFAVGTEPGSEYRRLHEVGVVVFEWLLGLLREGVASDQVLDAAGIIDDAGYTIYDDLVHMANGGVYAPYVRTRQTASPDHAPFTYAENMLVVIQPNIVTKDLRMGIQVGEMVRVTKSGIERLHRAPLEFAVC